MGMPNHQLGANFTFPQLLHAYNADPQEEDDAHYLLFRGDEILALCLRYHFNPEPGEVWVGDQAGKGDRPGVAEWGRRLAELKDKKTLPVYYSPRNRTLYEFKGEYLITGDTVEKDELAKRHGPVPLSRIVFIKPAPRSTLANQAFPQKHR